MRETVVLCLKISGPKIEVREGEREREKKRLAPAFPGPRSAALQQTPQRLPWWGGETPTNGGEIGRAHV